MLWSHTPTFMISRASPAVATLPPNAFDLFDAGNALSVHSPDDVGVAEV
jgi:hypothetical protein